MKQKQARNSIERESSFRHFFMALKVRETRLKQRQSRNVLQQNSNGIETVGLLNENLLIINERISFKVRSVTLSGL